MLQYDSNGYWQGTNYVCKENYFPASGDSACINYCNDKVGDVNQNCFTEVK